MAGSLAQETAGIDVRSLANGKQARWFALAASSMVVLFASVRIHRNNGINCGDEEAEISFSGTEFCKRVNLGISLGVITFLFALVNSFYSHILASLGGYVVELALTAVLLVMWTFGLGFITFGGDLSPGTHIGNLYFSTWISFALVVRLDCSFEQKKWKFVKIIVLTNIFFALWFSFYLWRTQ